MSLISVFEKLSEEDKAILARHQSRVSGFISMETLAEYFPNIDVQTSLRILETLLRSQHVKTGKHGCYTFVDPTGEIESGDLEEELRVLADFKRNLPDQILTSSSSNILENRVREDTLGERAPSGEECIVLRRENYLGVDGKDILETPLGRKVSGRKGSYDALMSHQRPSRADPSRKWSLEGTSFDARSLKSFKQSTPVVGNFGNPMSSPEHVTRRRRSSEERSPSFNMSEERNSCGTMRNPPPELNETIRFEVDSPDTSFATPLNDEAGSNPAILPGPADATLEVEPSMFTNDGYDSTSSELASRFRALEFASSEDVSPAESREELSDLSRVEDTPTETNPLTATNVSKSREAPLELNTASSEPIPSSVHNQAEMAIEEAERASTVEVPLKSIEAHDRTEPTAAAPQESDQIHLRKEEVEDHVEDPCRALEVFCQCMNLKPPAYNLTYMPMQEVFYCLLFVGNKSFPSFPTESVTEEGARKVAAEKAVKNLGITAGMVATRFENLMINPKWGIRNERPVSKSQVPQTEP